jgi:hypothetical protein
LDGWWLKPPRKKHPNLQKALGDAGVSLNALTSTQKYIRNPHAELRESLSKTTKSRSAAELKRERGGEKIVPGKVRGVRPGSPVEARLTDNLVKLQDINNLYPEVMSKNKKKRTRLSKSQSVGHNLDQTSGYLLNEHVVDALKLPSQRWMDEQKELRQKEEEELLRSKLLLEYLSLTKCYESLNANLRDYSISLFHNVQDVFHMYF